MARDSEPNSVLEAYFDQLLTPLEDQQTKIDDAEEPIDALPEPVVQPFDIEPSPELINQPLHEVKPTTLFDESDAVAMAPEGQLQMVIPSALPELEEQRLRALAMSIQAQLHVDSSALKLSDQAVQEIEKQADSWTDTGRPFWAEGEFDCLVFDLQGLKLGLPLVSLGSIHTLTISSVTALPGQGRQFMGSIAIFGQQFTVVDSAELVMPERASPEKRAQYRYIVTLDHSRWALAISGIENAKRFHPDAVHWRTVRTQRPWLAGTIREEMVALMDPSALCELLHKLA